MNRNGLFPLFYHPDVELEKNIKACYDGGRDNEFQPPRGDFCPRSLRTKYISLHKELPENAVGVGSVTDAGAARL